MEQQVEQKQNLRKQLISCSHRCRWRPLLFTAPLKCVTARHAAFSRAFRHLPRSTSTGFSNSSMSLWPGDELRPSIHPLSITPEPCTPLHCTVAEVLEPIPAVFGRRRGYTLDKVPVYHKTTSRDKQPPALTTTAR